MKRTDFLFLPWVVIAHAFNRLLPVFIGGSADANVEGSNSAFRVALPCS